ncbi:MAG: hypothetical protein M9894_28375 [Planctomycetes bacterium]|nr:hypothetical protein [Planctomycetota bacterium]
MSRADDKPVPFPGRPTGRWRRLATRAVVGLAWAGSTLAALWLILRYGSNVPYTDGWDMVPTLTRAQPVTLDWLWSQHNEHRVLLPRLLLLALHAVVIDFRIPMVFDALATAALALALLVGLERARGAPRLTDAFVPLALLHLGHAVNLLWGWQVQFYASTLLVGLVLVALLRAADDPTRAAVVTGVAALLLPLCGGNGVGLVPPLAAWAVWVGLRHRRALVPGTRRRARVAIGLGAAATALAGLYFVGYEPVPYHPSNAGMSGKLLAAAKVTTVGLGPGAQPLWPLSGVVAGLVLAAAGVGLAWAWRERPHERERVGGLAALMAGLAALGLAIGSSRDGFEPRYVLLMAPLWCAAYVTFTLYGPPRLAAAGRAALLGAALVLLVPNTRAGLDYAWYMREALGAFERDMRAGTTADVLVARHAGWLHPHHDVLKDYMPMLRRAEVGAFRALRDAPPAREVPLPLVPASTRELEWRGHAARLTGHTPSAVFMLPEARRARGLRLRYRSRNQAGTAPHVKVFWRGPDEDFSHARSWKSSATGDRANWERIAWTRLRDDASTMHVWFEDALVHAIRLDPDLRPGEFELLELVVLCAPEVDDEAGHR